MKQKTEILSVWKHEQKDIATRDPLCGRPVIVMVDIRVRIGSQETVQEWSIPWAVPAEDIGTVWREDSLVYNPEIGIWELDASSEDGFVYSTFSVPGIMNVDPHPIVSDVNLPAVCIRLYHDYLMGWYQPCNVHEKDANIVDMSFHCLFQRPASPAKQFLRVATLLQSILSGKFPHKSLPWAYSTIWKECASIGMHRILDWVWPPGDIIRYDQHRTISSFDLPFQMLLHTYYIHDDEKNRRILAYWLDDQVLPMWSRLDSSLKTNIERNLLFYLPVIGDPEKDIRLELPEMCIPRIMRASVGDPDGDFFSTFNPSIAMDGDNVVCNIRTANYNLSTYRSRDMENPNVVMTKNFIHIPGNPSWVEIVEEFPSEFNQKSTVKGLEDIRLFVHNHEIYFLANACDRIHKCNMPVCVFGHIRKDGRAKSVVLDYGQKIEKNWAPLIVGGNLYVVYSYDPMVILDLTLLLNTSPDKYPASFRPRPVVSERFPDPGCRLPLMSPAFRGSGPFIMYAPSIYLGIIHQVLFDHQGKRKYYHRFVMMDFSHKDRVDWCFSAPFVFWGTRYRIEYAMGIVQIAPGIFQIPFSYMDKNPSLRMIHADEIFQRLRWNPVRSVPRYPILPNLLTTDHGQKIYINFGGDEQIRIPSRVALKKWVETVFFRTGQQGAALFAERISSLIWGTPQHEWIFYPSFESGHRPFWFETYCPKRHDRWLYRLSSATPNNRIVVNLNRVMMDLDNHTWRPMWMPQCFPVYLAEYTDGWPSHTYWINRTCDADRRFAFIQRMNGIPTTFHRVEAVNGSDPRFLTDWPLCRYIDPGKHLAEDSTHQNRRTIALTLSHFKVLETISREHPSASPDQWFMVMEDDACIDHISQWPCPMSVLINSIAPWTGLCSIARLFPIREELYTPAQLTEPLLYYGTTLAYMIRYGAIPDMLSVMYQNPAPVLDVSDKEIFRACKMDVRMTRFPFMTFPDGNGSTVHKGHVPFQEKCQKDFRDRFFGLKIEEMSRIHNQ